MEQDTPQQESKKDDQTQYLKRPILKETDIPNPIQGPIKDPNKVFHFMKDVHDSTVPKMWGIFLNEDRLSVGDELLALDEGADPKDFSTRGVVHYFGVFYAHRFVMITNHMTDDATPTEEDKKLIKRLERVAEILEGDFADYIIVAGNHYWSMNIQNGTACHCGHQHYIEGEL